MDKFTKRFYEKGNEQNKKSGGSFPQYPTADDKKRRAKIEKYNTSHRHSSVTGFGEKIDPKTGKFTNPKHEALEKSKGKKFKPRNIAEKLGSVEHKLSQLKSGSQEYNSLKKRHDKLMDDY